MTSRNDPMRFKPCKTKPVGHITVPPPGSFTHKRKDVTSPLKSQSIDKTCDVKRRGISLGTTVVKHNSNEVKNRISARNERAVYKHKQSYKKKEDPKLSYQAKSITASSAASATIASSSAKAAKEKELAVKLKLLQSLRDKDLEVSDVNMYFIEYLSLSFMLVGGSCKIG